MIVLVHFFGRLFAFLPEFLVHATAVLVADLYWFFARSRRRLVLANLHHAFPEKDHDWLKKIGRKSVRETIEFGILAIALPFFNERRLRKVFSVSPKAGALLQTEIWGDRPAVLLGPHLGPQEGHALLPFFFPEITGLGVIFRPLDNEKVDRWIREARGRFGVELFSRKEGLQNAIRFLRQNKWLGIFFDQNARENGALITFFDRVASATELPAMLAARFDANVLLFYTARRGFWRIEICGNEGPTEKSRETLTIEINLWLEKLLQSDESLIPSWLWLHNRWRHQGRPTFSLREKKNLLEVQNKFLGRSSTPRKEPFFIHLPENLSEVVFLLPLLRTLRQSRPDIAITLIGKDDFLPLLTEWELCEEAVALPSNHSAERRRFRKKMYRRYPTVHLVFSKCPQADRDARAIGAPHRYGIEIPGEERRDLTRCWNPPKELIEPEIHPFELLEAFFRHHDLNGEIDRTPFGSTRKTDGESKVIGVLWDASEANGSEQREGWRELVAKLVEGRSAESVRILQVGGDEFRNDWPADFLAVESLSQLRDELVKCDVVIGRLSGEIHLANALGIRTIALASSRSDTPVFDAPFELVDEVDLILAEVAAVVGRR